jgi:hypothetical protein
MATAIGSLPHTDPEAAVDLVMENLPEAPVWPQLSARGFREQMEIQYSEGMSCRKVDEEKGRIHFKTDGDPWDDLAQFYEVYTAALDPESGTGDCSALAITSEYAAGLWAMKGRLAKEKAKRPFVKVQTVGPCTFTLTIVDQAKRALFYNEEFRDMAAKALAMKCRWQIDQFKPFADRVICFLDEPILSAFGSSTYVSVQREDVVRLLREMAETVHAGGALCGVHCCGNTEWSLLVDAGVDIVNFDAYGFGETVAMYPEHMRKHIEGGGVLAWGVVPTNPSALHDEKVESLAARYEKLVDHLAAKSGLDKQRLFEQSIITPSCGAGSMSEADAVRVMQYTRQLSEVLRKKHGC